MGLVEHAERELRRAGLFDEDSDYGGMLAESTMKLIKTFAEEGHSGNSAHMQVEIFSRLASYKTLTPLTDDPEEWMNVAEYQSPDSPAIWQNRRDSSCFSNDGGKTYYSIDDKDRKIKTSEPSNPPQGYGVMRTSGIELMTQREREVLDLMARGNSTKKVAEILGLSIKTIECHQKHIKGKIGIKKMPELIVFAVKSSSAVKSKDSAGH